MSTDERNGNDMAAGGKHNRNYDAIRDCIVKQIAVLVVRQHLRLQALKIEGLEDGGEN